MRSRIRTPWSLDIAKRPGTEVKLPSRRFFVYSTYIEHPPSLVHHPALYFTLIYLIAPEVSNLKSESCDRLSTGRPSARKTDRCIAVVYVRIGGLSLHVLMAQQSLIEPHLPIEPHPLPRPNKVLFDLWLYIISIGSRNR